MKKGIVRIKRVHSSRFSTKAQRYISIEPRDWLFRRNNEHVELECMVDLVSRIDVAEVRLDSSRWAKGPLFLKRDGWLEDGQGGWAFQPFGDYQRLMRAMLEAQNEGESFELQILTADAETVIAQINDNDEYWFLLASLELFNDEWLMQCKEDMIDWEFKWKIGK